MRMKPPSSLMNQNKYSPTRGEHQPEDIKSGHRSWGFHEGEHGARILDYLEAHPLPKLNPENKAHTRDWTWADAANEWKGAMENYNEALEEFHIKETDCVGHVPAFCK